MNTILIMGIIDMNQTNNCSNIPDNTNRPTNVEQQETCLHKLCPSCNGTGINKYTGEMCIHGLACPCPKCSPRS